jgi:hypothetical protein
MPKHRESRSRGVGAQAARLAGQASGIKGSQGSWSGAGPVGAGGKGRGPTTEQRDPIEPGMEDFDHTGQVFGIGSARHDQFQKHLPDCPCKATREEALALGALGPLLV